MLHRATHPALRLCARRIQSPQLPSRSFKRSLCTSTPTKTTQSYRFLNSYRLAIAVAAPLAATVLPNLSVIPTLSNNELRCDSDRSYSQSEPIKIKAKVEESVSSSSSLVCMPLARRLTFG
jgi:hypothetical protein